MKQFLGAVMISLCILSSCENKVDEAPQSVTSDVKLMEVMTEKNGFANMRGTSDSTTFLADDYEGEYKDEDKKQQPPVTKQVRSEESLIKKEFDKKIVKSATLGVETKDFKVFSKKLSDRVMANGGYISDEVQTSSDYKIEAQVVIRVPVDKFDATMDELVNSADNLTEKRISAEDQTREYVDGRSRLEAKKQVRLRYLDLLKQAKNMTEIIEVQSEINSIQEEIELVTGRINQINQTAAMSTISLTYFQVLDATVIDDKGDGFFDRVWSSFAKGWNWIGELMIGLITIWPLLLIMAVAGFFLRKKLLTSKPA